MCSVELQLIRWHHIMQHLLRRCCVSQEIRRTFSSTATVVQEKPVYVNFSYFTMLVLASDHPHLICQNDSSLFFYL